MTLIESEEINLAAEAKDVYSFLEDLNNHQKLMPEQVTDWSSTKDGCTFTIKNTGTLNLVIETRTPYSKITLVPGGKVPFPFTLSWILTEKANGCAARLILKADMNAFIKMMTEKPLKNFIAMQGNALKKIFQE